MAGSNTRNSLESPKRRKALRRSLKSGALGFTVVELMITLAVAIIILAIALPASDNMLRNNRLTSSANALVATLAYARSEAVKRGLAVTVCASSDSIQCVCADSDCSTITQWETGWIVFTDSGTTNKVDGIDEILRVYQRAREDNVGVEVTSGAIRYLSSGALSNY